MRSKVLILSLLLLVTLSSMMPTTAQSNITLTFAVPHWQVPNFQQDFFDDFEAAHPGVRVAVTAMPEASNTVLPAAFGIEDHLNIMQQRVTSGDVVLVDSLSISVEATRARLFLNLQPIVDGNTDFNPNSYYPAIWKSFQGMVVCGRYQPGHASTQ